MWYVAYVKSCQEKKVAEALTEKGEECFLPVQHVRKQWSDRIKWVDELVIRGLVFIHTTPSQRIPLMQEIYGIYAYMTDGGTYHPVEIPQDQMDTFMFMLSKSKAPISVMREPLKKGEKIVVVKGPLMGLEGEMVDFKNRHHIVVRLGVLGSVLAEVSPDDVERKRDEKKSAQQKNDEQKTEGRKNAGRKSEKKSKEKKSEKS